MQTVRKLLEQLRQPGARIGVGLWLLPDEYVGKEEQLAERLDLYPLDLRKVYLDQLPSEARFSGLTRPNGHQKLLETIRLVVSTRYKRDCVLAYLLDLLLLGLEVDERQRFWHATLGGIPYPTTHLILTLPEKASALFAMDLRRKYSDQIVDGKLE